MGRAHTKSGKKQTAPRKGTKSRAVMLMMMRRQGATQPEIQEATGATPIHVTHMMIGWLNFWGWDARFFRLRKTDPRWGPKSWVTYRLVGKIKPNGGYRSFTLRDFD